MLILLNFWKEERIMKKIVWLAAALLVGLMMTVNVQAEGMEDYEFEELVGRPAKFIEDVFPVYKDRMDRTNHFAPSGWMGDYGDVRMNDGSKNMPYSGKTCIKFTYSAEGKQGSRWAGVYWQNPANNWGEKKGGYDITGATKLTFWLRGEKGGERIEEIKIGGIGGMYPDSDAIGMGPIDLTTERTQYQMDLETVDLSYINGGFCWVINADANPDGCVFYFDDIQYEK